MPENTDNKTTGGRIGRGVDITSISGIEDIVFDDDISADEIKTPAEDVSDEDYEKWLEENLKESKGYGQKVSYEGEIPEGDGSWYDNSTHAAYDAQMADAQARIRALKERDAKIKAREDFIHDMMPKWNNGYSGDPNHFWAQLGSVVWYGASALAGAGIAFAAGRRGVDMVPMAGVGGLIGAIIRYNGKEGYSLFESMQHGAVEIGLLIASLIIGVWSFFGHVPYQAMLLLAGGFSALGVFFRERIFFARPMTEVFYKTLLYIIVPPIVIGVITAYYMLKEAGYLA